MRFDLIGDYSKTIWSYNYYKQFKPTKLFLILDTFYFKIIPMTYSKVIIGFNSNLFTDWNLVGKATHIIESMTDNPFFLTPKPTLEELTQVQGTFVQSLEKAEDGSKQDTVNKNNNRAALENMLRDMGVYVQATSTGNEAMILSAGFDVKKPSQQTGPLEQATGNH